MKIEFLKEFPGSHVGEQVLIALHDEKHLWYYRLNEPYYIEKSEEGVFFRYVEEDEMEDNTYRVELWHKDGGTEHVYAKATTYVKAGFYCIYEPDKDRVTKWPIGDIYRTIEEYKPSARRSDG